jgi:hypothetical protein
VEVKLAYGVADRLVQLPQQRRGRLIMTLHQLALRGKTRDGLLTVRTAHDAAACEALPSAGVLLVYALISLDELRVLLFGAEVVRRHRAHEGRRIGRGPTSRR